MAWKTMDIPEQRVRFVVAATQQMRPFSALCAEYEISRPTGYLWLKRYRQQGVQGIAEQSRRPHRSPRRTGAALERQVVRARQHHPDWGARKLHVVLAREGVQVPANTIHRILLRHDLVLEEDRRTAAVQRFERARPNELWQMDFKGPKGWPQAVGPLSVLDDHSRYLRWRPTAARKASRCASSWKRLSSAAACPKGCCWITVRRGAARSLRTVRRRCRCG